MTSKLSNKAGPTPDVSVMIKATVLDAFYLNVMTRHMIAQARFPFKEKLIVIDRQPNFKGKYGTRDRANEKDLDKIVENLLTDHIIDRVVDVDTRPSVIEDVMERYFPGDASHVSTHDFIGGPIYATLFGIESVPTEYVLQMDADIFFYTNGASWVQESLNLMIQDSSLWLMMTHPGPSSRIKGTSVGSGNRCLSSWDEKNNLWYFSTAITRYFLCNRQNLYGKLKPIRYKSGYAPLECSISESLKRYGTFRGVLGDLASWYLHAWYHGEPFPKMVQGIANAIEKGLCPAIQRGNQELRLDFPKYRKAWQKLIQRNGV